MSSNNFRKQEMVHVLAGAVLRGGRSLGDVPGLLRRIIEEDMWQSRSINGEMVVQFDPDNDPFAFKKFVEAGYPEGLGTTIDTLKELCNIDPPLRQYLTFAEDGKRKVKLESREEGGLIVDSEGHVRKGNIAGDSDFNNIKKYAIGTSRDYAFQRLYDETFGKPKDRTYDKNGDPIVKNHRVAAIRNRVLTGELKPNEGMMEAGFRKKRVAVRMDDPPSAARTILKYMEREQVIDLITLLEREL